MLPREYMIVRLQTDYQKRGLVDGVTGLAIDKTPRKQPVNDADSMQHAAEKAADMLDAGEVVVGSRLGRRHLLEVTDHVGRKARFSVTCVKVVAHYEGKEVADA